MLRPLGLPFFLLVSCATVHREPSTEQRLAEVERRLQAAASDDDLDSVLLQLDGLAADGASSARFQALRGDATLQLAARARDAGRTDAVLLRLDAIAALRQAVALDRDARPPRLQLAAALLDDGQRQEAGAIAGELFTTVRPADDARLGAFVDLAERLQQLPQLLAPLQARRDATALWHQGRVRYLLALTSLPAAPAQALTELPAAMQCFAAAQQAAPDYRDSCEQWTAMCLGLQGNLAFLAGDLANAEASLLAATRLRPDQLDAVLGAGLTVKLGLLRLGDRIMRDTPRATEFWRAAATAANADLDVLNNAAVFARDLGVKRERAGQADAAAAQYEYSYATYQRAVALDPSNVRLRNDCALIAIHHLGRDWERAKAMLDAAILDGERMLRDALAVDGRARQDLDEAVGDCYENLALWQLRHGQDAVAAKAAALASLEHFPGATRPGARRHLQAAERLLH